MTLWFLFALMTAAAMFAVLWPLSRRAADRGGSDIAVYRDQLDEIARDRSAGLIGEAEAEAAKVEVSRRLLGAAEAAAAVKSISDTSPVWRRRSTALAALVLLPAGAVTVYLMLGSPQMPGQPLAARVTAIDEQRSVDKMIAQVEAHVAANPNDGRAWEVLAPIYMRLGRYDDAVKALRNVLRLNGSTAAHEADLGEALVFAANGVVTPEAKTQFDRAFALDGQDVMARFYLGMAADQAGNRAEAEGIWRDLLAKAPPGAPWVPMVRQTMERTAQGGAAPAAVGAPAPAPSPAEVADGAKAPPDHSDSAIIGMVARLADRLKKDGSDPDGWAQLVRSYRALGQTVQAEAAIADARRALAGDPAKLLRFAESAELAAPAAPTAPAAPAASAPGPSSADIAAAQQLAPDQQNQMVTGMVARLADRLKKDGSDPAGWEQLVRSYRVMGQNDKAEAAMADARRALAADPAKLKQFNEGAEAAPTAPAGPAAPAARPAPVTPVAPAAGAPGPSAADIAAAQKLAPDQQNQMIVSMVARLADRLKQNGSDVEGWLRLLRAYSVLGDRDKAQNAAGDAKRALAGDPDKIRRIDELVKELGLQG
jgi:cytochrome c-type biogenesis protein CcmH